MIRRREETAATRSLLNTAKVMEDNPVALRLKELETLERVAERIDKISVFGGLDQVLNGLVQRAGVDPALVDDVIWGTSSQSGFQGADLGRMAALNAGFTLTGGNAALDSTSVGAGGGTTARLREWRRRHCPSGGVSARAGGCRCGTGDRKSVV